jgi:hypothetical protein
VLQRLSDTPPGKIACKNREKIALKSGNLGVLLPMAPLVFFFHPQIHLLRPFPPGSRAVRGRLIVTVSSSGGYFHKGSLQRVEKGLHFL